MPMYVIVFKKSYFHTGIPTVSVKNIQCKSSKFGKRRPYIKKNKSGYENSELLRVLKSAEKVLAHDSQRVS